MMIGGIIITIITEGMTIKAQGKIGIGQAANMIGP